MGSYKFRVPLLIAVIACSARALLDAPPRAVYALGGVALLYLLVLRAVAWLALRRIRAAGPYLGQEWTDCDAKIALDAHTFAECHNQKGHDGPHSGAPHVEWQG